MAEAGRGLFRSGPLERTCVAGHFKFRLPTSCGATVPVSSSETKSDPFSLYVCWIISIYLPMAQITIPPYLLREVVSQHLERLLLLLPDRKLVKLRR